MQPERYAQADYVVVGEVEDSISALLEDLGAGVKSGRYRAPSRGDRWREVVPRYDLARLDQYLFVGVGFSRGCPFSCEFCAQIEIFGNKTRTKSAEQIIAELQTVYDLGYRGQIDFGYDNLIGAVAR